METLITLLNVIGAVPNAVKGVAIGRKWLGEMIGRLFPPSDSKSSTVPRGKLTSFIHQLGLTTPADVDRVLERWPSPPGFTNAQREELAVLLRKLVIGARFHTTHGTRLSSYVTAEQLLTQLLEHVEPVRHLGEKIDGWKLTKYLGAGGFGEVWLARNDLFHAERVYKFFTRDGAADWLAQEALALRSIWKRLGEADCPNVIDYLDVNIDARPHPYLVLEYAALGSLDDWIRSKPEHRAAIGVTELIRGIVRGVSDAHRHGIHHRDVKPANILLAGNPRDVVPKIADFGLSDVEAIEPGASQSSQVVLVGTSMYLPPEASNPAFPRDSAQDDVFALGVVWFQVLTGELVRPSYDFAEQLAAAGADSRSVKFISKCLAAPTRRYPTASELYEDIDRIDPPPGPGEWAVPEGCFDVAGVAREYLERTLA